MPSLTTFLQQPEIKEKFKQEFPVMPKLDKQTLLVPSSTEYYNVVGIAFDYLLRFYLKQLNPEAITNDWIAYQGMSKIRIEAYNYKMDNGYNYDSLEMNAQIYIDKTQFAYSKFLETGILTDELIKSCLYLAPIDIVHRTGTTKYLVDTINNIDNNTDVLIKELKELHNIIPKEKFIANNKCFLNPTLGIAIGIDTDLKKWVTNSTLEIVGALGADADIIIDDTLIDIKTTVKYEITREYLNQLIGYYILSKLNGYEINKIGVYYSRHGHLLTLSIEDIINSTTFNNFQDWFCRTISKGEYNYIQLLEYMQNQKEKNKPKARPKSPKRKKRGYY